MDGSCRHCRPPLEQLISASARVILSQIWRLWTWIVVHQSLDSRLCSFLSGVRPTLLARRWWRQAKSSGKSQSTLVSLWRSQDTLLSWGHGLASLDALLALLCRQGELSCFVAGRCVEKRFCDHRLVRKCDHGSRVGKRCLQGEPEASLVYFCDS